MYLYNNLRNSYPYVAQKYFFNPGMQEFMIRRGSMPEEWKDEVTSGGTGMKLLLRRSV